MATITGSAGTNVLNGTLASDTIFGLGGNDVLTGLTGNDTLDGGTGADRMLGGLGDDIYIVDDSGDRVTEALLSGTDEVRSSVSFNLGATVGSQNVDNLFLRGTAVSGIGNALNNRITGNDSDNSLIGSLGKDFLSGQRGEDTLDGGLGDDALFGGGNRDNLNGGSGRDRVAGGNDTDVVNGGLGNDILTGDGIGVSQATDFFRFDTNLLLGNVDQITDFSAAFDQIQLDRDILSNLGQGVGPLRASLFRASADGQAFDLDDRIIYNTTTGALIYDSNGALPLGARQFATLSGAPTISAADFQIVP